MSATSRVSLLQAAIQASKGSIEYLRFETPMPTTADAAKVLGIAERQIIKTCIIGVGKPKRFVAVILQGTDRINWKKFEALSPLYKKHSFATPEETLQVTGYQLGGTPPVGLGPRVERVYIDQNVFGHPKVYGGGGEVNSLIFIEPPLMQELTKGERISVAEQMDSENKEGT